MGITALSTSFQNGGLGSVLIFEEVIDAIFRLVIWAKTLVQLARDH